jgi:hypothetical protein
MSNARLNAKNLSGLGAIKMRVSQWHRISRKIGDTSASYLVSRVQISNNVLCGRHKNGRPLLPSLAHLMSKRQGVRVRLQSTDGQQLERLALHKASTSHSGEIDPFLLMKRHAAEHSLWRTVVLKI